MDHLQEKRHIHTFRLGSVPLAIGLCTKLAEAMGIDGNMNLDLIFNDHEHIFGAQKSRKNEAQWTYMKQAG